MVAMPGVVPPRAIAARRWGEWLRGVALPLGLAAVFLALWEAAVRFAGVPEVILPAPSAIVAAVWKGREILLRHAIPTTVESALGFLLAAAVGVALAVLITYSRVLREALYPNLVFFQLIPKIALAPLFIVWLGIGSQSRLVFALFISFFPVVVATATGLAAVDANLLRLCRSLDASAWQVFAWVRFPSALPHLFSGLKVAITLSIIGVIIGEFITAQAGLGYLIIFATARAETTVAMAAIVVLCVAGLLLYGAVALAERVAINLFGVPELDH